MEGGWVGTLTRWRGRRCLAVPPSPSAPAARDASPGPGRTSSGEGSGAGSDHHKCQQSHSTLRHGHVQTGRWSSATNYTKLSAFLTPLLSLSYDQLYVMFHQLVLIKYAYKFKI